jgi:hypothetical protein
VKTKKRKPLRLAIVEWHDAHASGDFEDDELLEDKHKPRRVQSVGWVWRYDKQGITLVACVDQDTPPDYDRRLFIPKGMVRRVSYIRGHTA